jgi:hypothetical protein
VLPDEGTTGGDPPDLEHVMNTWMSVYVARFVERELEEARRMHHVPGTLEVRRRRRWRTRRAS